MNILRSTALYLINVSYCEINKSSMFKRDGINYSKLRNIMWDCTGTGFSSTVYSNRTGRGEMLWNDGTKNWKKVLIQLMNVRNRKINIVKVSTIRKMEIYEKKIKDENSFKENCKEFMCNAVQNRRIFCLDHLG